MPFSLVNAALVKDRMLDGLQISIEKRTKQCQSAAIKQSYKVTVLEK